MTGVILHRPQELIAHLRGSPPPAMSQVAVDAAVAALPELGQKAFARLKAALGEQIGANIITDVQALRTGREPFATKRVEDRLIHEGKFRGYQHLASERMVDILGVALPMKELDPRDVGCWMVPTNSVPIGHSLADEVVKLVAAALEATPAEGEGFSATAKVTGLDISYVVVARLVGAGEERA